MITKEQIADQEKQYVLTSDISDKKYIKFAKEDFTAGAEWATQQLDPLCSSAVGMIEKLQAENSKLNDILEKINAVMWQSHMVKDRGIRVSDCDSIMELLEGWAKIDS